MHIIEKHLKNQNFQFSFLRNYDNWFNPFFFVLIAHQMQTQHQFLEETIGTSQDENYAFWLVTLLSWLLPTLVIALGLLDPLLAYVLSKKKQQREQDDWGQIRIFQVSWFRCHIVRIQGKKKWKFRRNE